MSAGPPEEPPFPLNYDVTVIILDKLPLHQVIQMRLVCKGLKNYIDEYLKTIRILAIYEDDDDLSKLSRLRQPMDLDMDSILRNAVKVRFDSLLWNDASIIVKLFPKLDELYLLSSPDGFPIINLIDLITPFPGLKKLAIPTIPDIDDILDDDDDDDIPDESNVKTFIESLYGFKSLDTLIVIDYCKRVTKEVREAEFKIKKEFLQQLRRLNFPGITGRQADMQETNEQPTNAECENVYKMKLESITLDYDDMALKTNTIQQLSADNFPNLKHVSVECIWHDGILPGFEELFHVNKAIQSIQIYSDTDWNRGELADVRIYEALNAFPELKLLQITAPYLIQFLSSFMSSLALYMPNFINLETIVFNFRSWNDFVQFDQDFMEPLQNVSGGSVKKIVLQSIIERCHVAFQNYLETDLPYQIEILPAKSFVEE